MTGVSCAYFTALYFIYFNGVYLIYSSCAVSLYSMVMMVGNITILYDKQSIAHLKETPYTSYFTSCTVLKP